MPLLVRLKEGHTVEVMRRYAADFTARTGIDIRLEVLPEGAAHDAMSVGGERPDVVTVPLWSLDELIDRGGLLPLGELMDNAGVDWDGFAPAAVGALTRDGQRWAVPHTLTGGVLSYRADLFERLGLAAPATTDDVLRAAQAIGRGAPGHHGLVARASVEYSSLETYSGWAWADHTRLIPDRGEPDLAMVRGALDGLVTALRTTGPADLARRSYAEVGDLVLEGRAAQFFDTSAWGFFFENSDISAVAGRMGYTTIRGPRAPAQFLYAEGLGITAWSADPSAAAAFVSWRHSSETLRREVLEVGRLDLPRTDLPGTDWYEEEVARRRLGRYLAVVRRAWEEAETGHLARRPDFVARARELMRTISGAVGRGWEQAEHERHPVAEEPDAGRSGRDGEGSI